MKRTAIVAACFVAVSMLTAPPAQAFQMGNSLKIAALYRQSTILSLPTCKRGQKEYGPLPGWATIPGRPGRQVKVCNRLTPIKFLVRK